MDGLQVLAEVISQELRRLLPGQRKTQRVNLALLVATMLDMRSANLMDLAAGLELPWKSGEPLALGYAAASKSHGLL